MSYFIKPSELKNTFSVPEAVVDKHMSLASDAQIRVLLYALCHLELDFDVEKIAAGMSMTASEVEEALDFWADVKLICRTDTPASEPVRAVTGVTVKPSRFEVAQRGLESPEIAFLLNEAQQKFGRALRQNEASTLVWIYDENGMPLSVILMILEYASSIGSLNISFIEKTAVRWINDGITNVYDAEREIVKMNERRSAYGLVSSAMGLNLPRPSEELLKCSDLWVNEWGFDRDCLKKAYDVCVDNTASFNLKYIKKVLESWHKAGVKTVSDIDALSEKETATEKGAYKKTPEIFMDEE